MSEDRDRLYALRLTGFSRPDAERRAARFLAMVFKNKTEPEIREVLTQLPVLITEDVSIEVAQTLSRHLEALGARVETTSRRRGERYRDELEGESMRRVSRPLPPDTLPLATETSYAMARPGRRDTIPH